MLPSQCSMPRRSLANWREAANRPMPRSSSSKAGEIFSKFRWTRATRTASAPPASSDVRISSPVCGDRTPVYSVAILDTVNVPTPSVPETLTPAITSWSEIDGLVRVSVVIGPLGRERCAKDGPCRQAADDWSDGKAMMPSSVRCRRARNRTDRNCRAKRECGQAFFHYTISTSSHRKTSRVRSLKSFGRSAGQAYECKSPARSRHWRSSKIATIGLCLSGRR